MYTNFSEDLPGLLLKDLYGYKVVHATFQDMEFLGMNLTEDSSSTMQNHSYYFGGDDEEYEYQMQQAVLGNNNNQQEQSENFSQVQRSSSRGSEERQLEIPGLSLKGWLKIV